MAEVPLGKRVVLVGGARREGTDFSIVPTNPILGLVEVVVTDEELNRYIVLVPDEKGQASIRDARWLPALGVIVELAPSMKLRANYAQTIARPTYRELAPVATEEYLAGDEFLGNPDLVISSIDNYDLRWEWFPRPGDVLAASLFYKAISDPIEYISFGATNRTFIQPLNYGSGKVRGVELEFRTTLERAWDPLKYLSVGINGTYLDSEVEVPASEQKSLADFGLDEETRALQGQPEYLLNVNLAYDNPVSGTTAGLFYNRVGETLFSGAARGNEDGVPDVFERAFTTFDVTFSQRIWRGLTLAIKATNLLQDQRGSFYRTPDGEELTKVLRRTASTYQAGVGYRW
jgi:TonB-dependent receptor